MGEMKNLKPYLLDAIHSNLLKDILERVNVKKPLKKIISSHLHSHGMIIFQEMKNQLQNEDDKLSELILELYQGDMTRDRLNIISGSFIHVTKIIMDQSQSLDALTQIMQIVKKNSSRSVPEIEMMLSLVQNMNSLPPSLRSSL